MGYLIDIERRCVGMPEEFGALILAIPKRDADSYEALDTEARGRIYQTALDAIRAEERRADGG